MKLIIATGNPGKARELERMLADGGSEVLTLKEAGLSGPPEDAPTFIENALAKARHAARGSGLPAVADDSGLAVDALDGAPGVYSARFAGEPSDDDANNRLLLERLAGRPAAERTARFHCVAVFLRHPDDPVPLVAHGVWSGRIVETPRGEQGFGYDPLFEDPVLGRTAAELDAEEKDARSHRGQALRALVQALQAARED